MKTSTAAPRRASPGRMLTSLSLGVALLAGACAEDTSTNAATGPAAGTSAKSPATPTTTPATTPTGAKGTTPSPANSGLPAEFQSIPTDEAVATEVAAKIDESNADAEFEKLLKEIEDEDLDG